MPVSSVLRPARGKQGAAAKAQYEMGRQYLAMERPEEALRAFAAALASDPSLAEAREAIGEVEQRFGATPQALGIELPAAAAETPEREPATSGEAPAAPVTEAASAVPSPAATAGGGALPPAATTTSTAAPAANPTPALVPPRIMPSTAPAAVSTTASPELPAAAARPRGRRIPVLPLLMAGVFSCLMFFLLKRRLGA